MSAKDNYSGFAVAPHLTEFNVPFNSFRDKHPQYKRFVGGGLISSQNTESEAENNGAKSLQAFTPARLRVLLLQRASTDAYPNFWEGPGGSSEDEDETILETVAREIWEETRLFVLEFVEFVGIRQWEKPAVGTTAKFTFIVKVTKGSNPQLKSDEHQRFTWATDEGAKDEELVTMPFQTPRYLFYLPIAYYLIRMKTAPKLPPAPWEKPAYHIDTEVQRTGTED